MTFRRVALSEKVWRKKSLTFCSNVKLVKLFFTSNYFRYTQYFGVNFAFMPVPHQLWKCYSNGNCSDYLLNKYLHKQTCKLLNKIFYILGLANFFVKNQLFRRRNRITILMDLWYLNNGTSPFNCEIRHSLIRITNPNFFHQHILLVNSPCSPRREICANKFNTILQTVGLANYENKRA